MALYKYIRKGEELKTKELSIQVKKSEKEQ